MCPESFYSEEKRCNYVACYFLRYGDVNVDLVRSGNTWLKCMQKLFKSSEWNCTACYTSSLRLNNGKLCTEEMKKKRQVDAKYRCVHFLHFYFSTFASIVIFFADSLVAFSLWGYDKSPEKKFLLHVCFGLCFISTQNTLIHAEGGHQWKSPLDKQVRAGN